MKLLPILIYTSFLLLCTAAQQTQTESGSNNQTLQAKPLFAEEWNIVNTINADCNTVSMAEVTAFFCPQLRNLYSTREFLDKGYIWATDRLTQFPGLGRIEVYSTSRETDFTGSLILYELSFDGI